MTTILVPIDEDNCILVDSETGESQKYCPSDISNEISGITAILESMVIDSDDKLLAWARINYPISGDAAQVATFQARKIELEATLATIEELRNGG